MLPHTVNDVVYPAHAPAIAGLTFRHLRGADDFPHMAAILNACNTADGSEWYVTAESLAAQYAHLTNSDTHDVLIAAIADQPIAYSRVEWRQIEDGPRLYIHLGHVHPRWRRHGIGAAMLQHNEARLREIAATHTEAHEQIFGSYSSGNNAGNRALLEQHGYSIVRYGYDMVRDLREPLPDAALPSHLHVRTPSADQYRTVWEADAEAFRDHWGYSAPSEEDYLQWRESPLFQPDIWKVAWDGDQIAGMVQNFINHEENTQHQRQRGYTEGISVRRPWRRQGVARALLVESMRMFRDMGMAEAALGVDADNPNGALRLYESVGFTVTRQGFTYHKPL